jgi:hypothetical protein
MGLIFNREAHRAIATAAAPVDAGRLITQNA